MSVKRIIYAIFLMKYKFINHLVYISMCLCTLSMLACSAGPPHGPKIRGNLPEGKTVDEFISAMKTRLNLTEEQEIQVRPIIKKEFATRRKIFEESMKQGPQGMESLKNKMQELQGTTEEKLEKILTKEQMKGYRKLIDEERQNMHKNRPRHRMPRF